MRSKEAMTGTVEEIMELAHVIHTSTQIQIRQLMIIRPVSLLNIHKTKYFVISFWFRIAKY